MDDYPTSTILKTMHTKKTQNTLTPKYHVGFDALKTKLISSMPYTSSMGCAISCIYDVFVVTVSTILCQPFRPNLKDRSIVLASCQMMLAHKIILPQNDNALLWYLILSI